MRWWAGVSDVAKTLIGVGVALVGFGASIVGRLPSLLVIVLLWAGLIISGVGVSRASMDIYSSFKMTFVATTTRHALILARIRKAYESRSGDDDDIEKVYQLGVSVHGAEYHVPPSHLRELVTAGSPKVLTVIERQSTAGDKLAGYFVLCPLTRNACQLILDGKIESGFAIRAEHLCPNFSEPTGFYITQLVGTASSVDRTAVLFHLYEVISEAVRHRSTFRYLFARPGTKDGLRWLKMLDFAPVDNRNSLVWVMNSGSMSQIFGQSEHPLTALRRMPSSTEP